MNGKRIFRGLAVIFLCGTVRGAEPVRIDFFYEPGCRDCEKIETQLLPDIKKQFPGACDIHAHDIGTETNFMHLLQLEHELSYTNPERAYLVVNRQYIFGPDLSHQEFAALISKLLRQKPSCPAPSAAAPHLAKMRFEGFTVYSVVAAGLLDGINPCAISTLVFFMSLLTVSKVRSRQLVLMGASFCLAAFLTYLALGFGLFRVLYLFSGFTVLRNTVEKGMAAVLLILAALSFHDAVCFRKTGRSADVKIQLSAGMKKRIHGVMRRSLGNAGMVWGGLLAGTAVTALESVCTGQVYVPTLVLILKDSAFSEPRAWMLLLLYNALFVLPLIVVFVAVYFGLRIETLLTLSRRNVVFSKILLGLFFVLMALVIIRA